MHRNQIIVEGSICNDIFSISISAFIQISFINVVKCG